MALKRKKSGLNINKFLRSVYYLFKDFPTRRGAYIRIIKSNEFPLKFCSIRWTENSKVMTRAKNILPHLKTYIQAVDKKPPDSKNYFTVKDFSDDIFLESKLSFLISAALELEPFLIYFQKNEPLVPFLHNKLYTLIKSLMSRILKSEIFKTIQNTTDLFRIEIEDEQNLCEPGKVVLGVVCQATLNKIVKPSVVFGGDKHTFGF